MRAAAPIAFSRCTLERATLFSWYEKYTPIAPEMSSAPQTSPRISRKYLRNRRPRSMRRMSRRCARIDSTGFTARSLDDFVGAQQHRGRQREAEALRDPGVDDQLELLGLLDGHQRRLLALEDARDIVPGAAENVLEVRT